jgi:hypothetical protein
MKIKIVIPFHEDQLPDPLRDLGILPGDVINDAMPVSETKHDAVRFQVWSDEHQRFVLCTVMAKNYKKI